jgi:hypothetical protein
MGSQVPTDTVLKEDADKAEIVSDFQKEIATVINKHLRENMSDTPDFILARFLEQCLKAHSVAVSQRDHWFGADMWGKTFKSEK